MLTNEFIVPLVGNPYYRNIGLIKVYDRNNHSYSVGEIIFERYDEQNFQYIIKPYWDSIDFLPHGLFQGIPGINMDLRRTEYYRVNMTPTIISMRTPSESREDVRQLMLSAGLDYYDRFEWLLRTEMRCGDDNLVVVRKPTQSQRFKSLDNINSVFLTPDDVLEIDSLSDFESSNASLVRYVYQILQSGVSIFIRNENRYLRDDERKAMMYLLSNMLISMERNIRSNRQQGRERAKMSGRYVGRKPIEIDDTLLKRVAYEFRNNHISEEEAMRKLGINSRSTFYRKLRRLKNWK